MRLEHTPTRTHSNPLAPFPVTALGHLICALLEAFKDVLTN